MQFPLTSLTRNARNMLAGEPVMVGSRVTCSPAPTDSDADFLALCRPGYGEGLGRLLQASQWERGGSLGCEASNFESWRLGEINLIIAFTKDFHVRFVAATRICKRLNLVDKADRIAVFRAVLYAESC